MPAPHVSLIVSTFNRLDLLQAMVASARATLPASIAVEWVIIDDGSTDGTHRWLESQMDETFRVISWAKNQGYATANNRGAEEARAPVAVFLNNDLEFRPGWLEPMLATLESQPAAFATGNLQFRTSDRELDHAGIVFTDWGLPYHFRAGLSSIRRRDVREFPAVTFACAAVRRDRFLALGGFDTRYRNGCEDVDLCLRARRRGWRCFVVNTSEVDHHVSASPGRKTAEERNLQRFLTHWHDFAAVWARDWEERWWLETRADRGPQPDPRPDGPARVLVDFRELSASGLPATTAATAKRWLTDLMQAAEGELVFEVLLATSAASSLDTWRSCGFPVLVDDPAQRTSLARSRQIDVVYSPFGRSDVSSPDIAEIGSLPTKPETDPSLLVEHLRSRCVLVRCANGMAVEHAVRDYALARDGLFIAPAPGDDASPAEFLAGARATVAALKQAFRSHSSSGTSWRWHDAASDITCDDTARPRDGATVVSKEPEIHCHTDEPVDRVSLQPLVIVKGWAFARADNPIMRIFVRSPDGRWEGAHGLARPDVAKAFGDAAGAEHSGFELRLPNPTTPGPITIELVLEQGQVRDVSFA